MHEKGVYKTKDLQTEKAYKDLASQTADIFNFAVSSSNMPEVMRTALQNDVYLFSGLKTHAQLFEASRLLLDESGSLKPYSAFANDFNKVNKSYNQTYLNTEYEYAVNAAQMAAKWAEFSDEDRYNLQYRTAGDNRVRDSHARLNGTTLPKSDPFWDLYYAPNGWNCRCNVVEVLKDKYPLSDSNKAIAEGEKATTQIGKSGKNQLEIFRFNPGKQKVIFPPEHPYGKVVGAGKVKEVVKQEIIDEQRVLRKQKDAEVKEWAQNNIPLSGKIIMAPNFKTGEVHLSRGTIKSIGDHFTEPNLKEVARNVVNNLKKCKYIDSAPLNPDSHNYEKKKRQGVTRFHYYEFEWNNKAFRLNTEEIDGKIEKPYSANLIIKK